MMDRIRFASISLGKRSDHLNAPLLNTLKKHAQLVRVWGRSEAKAHVRDEKISYSLV